MSNDDGVYVCQMMLGLKKNLSFVSLDWFQAKGHDQVMVIVYDWISLRLYVQ